jgi:hypothetical protein
MPLAANTAIATAPRLTRRNAATATGASVPAGAAPGIARVAMTAHGRLK